MLNSGQNWRFFVPCDLEIWRTTLKNNKAVPLLRYFKLSVSFHNHRSIQTVDTVRKHSIQVKIGDFFSLRWRHNDHASVSNHQPHGCLLNRLFRRKSKKTSKLRVTGLCAGNSPGTGEFPAQMASYAENVSIWWRHHVFSVTWKFNTLPWKIKRGPFHMLFQALCIIS